MWLLRLDGRDPSLGVFVSGHGREPSLLPVHHAVLTWQGLGLGLGLRLGLGLGLGLGR